MSLRHQLCLRYDGKYPGFAGLASAIGPATRAEAALKLPSILELPLNCPLTVALEYTPLG